MARWAAVVILLVAGAAHAQSVNVSFGGTTGGPGANYAAAGTAGVWNRVTGVEGTTFSLVGLDGAATAVQLVQTPTTTLLSGAPDPSVQGDDAALLTTGLVTTGAETCLALSGLRAGSYEVLAYAWTPDQPSVLSRTRQEQADTTIDVGGAWPGGHAEGVTYARYSVMVAADGMLPVHSGLAPGQPSAAFNGVQVHCVSATDGAACDAPAAAASSGGCAAGGDAGPGLALVVVLAIVLGFTRTRSGSSRSRSALRP